MGVLEIWFICLIGFLITGYAWYGMLDSGKYKKILRYVAMGFGFVALGLPFAIFFVIVMMVIVSFKMK